MRWRKGLRFHTIQVLWKTYETSVQSETLKSNMEVGENSKKRFKYLSKSLLMGIVPHFQQNKLVVKNQARRSFRSPWLTHLVFLGKQNAPRMQVVRILC